ncbi:MAG: hypothetical protein ACN6NT_08075 [Comamonas sp.]
MFPQLSIRSALTSLMCLLLSGCLATAPGTGADAATSSFESSGTTDARLTQGEQAEFFSRSGYQACLVGGATAALLCKLGNGKNKVCLASGLAVCGVAMGANYFLEQQRAQYSNATLRLQAMKKDVAEDTKRVAIRSATIRDVIRDDKKRMAELQKNIKAKKADTVAARKDLANIDKNIELMRKELNAMKDKSENYAKVLQEEKTGDAKGKKKELSQVDAEIKKLNSQVAALQEEIDGAYAQRSAITLG